MIINCLADYRRLLSDPVYRRHISRFHCITFTHWPSQPDQYLLLRRCHDWARSEGIEVRGKALFFTRGAAKSKADAQSAWDRSARRVEQITADFECCLWEVAAEAWASCIQSRPCSWSMDHAKVWVRKAFELYGGLTSAPLYYADFSPYHPDKFVRGVIPALAKWRRDGVPVAGLSLQIASSLYPRAPLSAIEQITKQSQQAGLLVEWPENIAWDVVGRWWPVGHPLAGPHVERRQASIYRDLQSLAERLDVERSSCWFPWAGHAYHWRWDAKNKRRQLSDCGLWREDWSPKPSLEIFESLLKPL